MKKLISTFLKLILICSAFNSFAAVPSVQASGLTITNRTSTTLSCSWTAGNGNRRLIVCKPFANPTITPSFTITNTYPSSTVYGQGLDLGASNYVIFKAITSTSVTITGLAPGTMYTVFVYEYNLSTNLGLDKYEFKTTITSANMQSATTLCDEPTIAPSAASGTVGYTTVDLSWIKGNGTSTFITIEEDTKPVNHPVDGNFYLDSSVYGTGVPISYISSTTNYVVYNDTGTSVTVTGLKPNFGYIARVYTMNCGGITQNYLTSSYAQVNFTTLNHAPTISSLSSLNICEGTAQTVALSGISDGSSDETQTLSVTASSSNTTLIPASALSLSYTSPSTTATLNFTPAAGQTGSSVITVSVNDNGWINSSTSVTFTVTVNPIPSMTSASSDTICSGNASGFTFTSSTSANFQWLAAANANTSGESTTLQTGNSISDVLINNSTSAQTITYSVTPVTTAGCSGATQTVNLTLDIPVTANTGADISLCSSSLNLSGNAAYPGTGTWSIVSQSTPTFTATIYSPNSENSLVGFTNVLTGNNITLRWTINSLLGVCPTTTDDLVITKISCPLTSGFTTSGNNLCIKPGDSVAVVFTDNSSPGSFPPINSYTWTFNGGNPSNATGVGPHTVYYSYENALTVFSASLTTVDNNSNQSTVAQNITIRPLPSTPGSISGSAIICQGQNNVSYSVASVLNADSYTWEFPSGASAINPDNTALTDFSTGAVSGIIKVAGVNSCGTGDTSTLTVTVNPLPSAAGTITGSDTVCQGQNGIAFTLPAVSNATTYQWTLPSGISVSGNSNAETLNIGTNAQSGTISIAGVNTCGTGNSSTFNLVVNPLPVAAGNITGMNNVCQNQAGVLFAVSTIQHAQSYSWSFPSGASASNPSDSAFVDFDGTAASGIISVAGVNACGTGSSSSFSITVNSLPLAAGSITGSDTVCAESYGIQFSIPSIINAGAYLWTFPTGVTAVNPDNTASADFGVNASSGIISVSGVNACGNGPASTFSVVVNPLPAAAVSIFGTDSVCQGATGVLFSTDTIAEATSYIWAFSGGANFSAADDSTLANFSAAATNGILTVFGRNACGDGAIASAALTVMPLPISPLFSGTMQIDNCPLPDSVLFHVPADTNATAFSWILPATANTNSNTANDSIYVQFSSLSGQDSIQVASVNGCGTSNYNFMVISPLAVNTPSICLITVDSLSQYNEIYWDKTGFASSDTFIVYRDTANNNYAPIGKVPFDSLSMFTDTVRTLYAANGDPNVSSWRYKIAVMDSCGQMSAMSDYHQTMFFQDATGNFSWNHYEIEGQITPVPVLNNYIFLRDDFSTGMWNNIQTLSASSTAYTDPNYTSYLGTGSWRVQTNWTLSCNSAFRTGKNPTETFAIINTSRSNIKSQLAPTDGVKDVQQATSITCYPNPAKDELTVVSAPGTHLALCDVNGKTLIAEIMKSQKTSLSVTSLANGLYILKAENNGTSSVYKILISH